MKRVATFVSLHWWRYISFLLLWVLALSQYSQLLYSWSTLLIVSFYILSLSSRYSLRFYSYLIHHPLPQVLVVYHQMLACPLCILLLWLTNCFLLHNFDLQMLQLKGSWQAWLLMCLLMWLVDMNPSPQRQQCFDFSPKPLVWSKLHHTISACGNQAWRGQWLPVHLL